MCQELLHTLHAMYCCMYCANFQGHCCFIPRALLLHIFYTVCCCMFCVKGTAILYCNHAASCNYCMLRMYCHMYCAMDTAAYYCIVCAPIHCGHCSFFAKGAAASYIIWCWLWVLSLDSMGTVALYIICCIPPHILCTLLLHICCMYAVHWCMFGLFWSYIMCTAVCRGHCHFVPWALLLHCCILSTAVHSMS